MTTLDTGLDRRQFLGRAILASLAIHALIALMIPALVQVAATQPLETITFVRITHVAAARAANPRPPSHPAAPKRVAQQVVAAVPKPKRVAQQVVAAVPKPKRAPATRPAPHAVASAVPAFRAAAAPPRRAAVTASVTTTATSAPHVALPIPKATAAPAPVKESVPSEGAHIVTGYMPFGATEAEPVLDVNVQHQLAAIGVHVHLTILVGDDGRTKHIDYHPPLDAALRAKIAALLVNASWDAAYCGGGIPCQGTAEIDL